MSSKIPATRHEAIDALVELDVARWGEGERDASRRIHARRTYGRALNTLANRAELAGSADAAELRAAADQALTADDLCDLRKGG